MDEEEMVEMVLDHFRVTQPVWKVSLDAGQALEQNFQDNYLRMAAIVQKLSGQGPQFVESFERILREVRARHSADPDEFERSIGAIDIPPPEPIIQYVEVAQGARLPSGRTGNMVVDTAVRATVWQAIANIFRALR